MIVGELRFTSTERADIECKTRGIPVFVVVLSVALVVAGRATAQPAQPQPTEPAQATTPQQSAEGADGSSERRQCGTTEAVAHFQRGLALYQERNPRAALFEFELAYECAPNYRVLYNIGTTQLELNDYAAAWHTYNRYLREGGSEIEGERRAQVELELGRIRPLIGSITIAVSREGAEVRFDDEVVGTSPLSEPLVVNIGRHEITASAPGYVTRSQTVRISAGDEAQVRLELEREQPRVAYDPRLVQPATARPEKPNRTAFWIALGSTGLLAAGAGAALGVTLSADSDLDDELDNYPPAEDEVDDARSRVRTWSTVTDVLGGAAIVAAAVTVILYLTEDTPDDETRTRPQGTEPGPRVDGTSVTFTF